MEYIDPQQELFSKLKIELEALGYAVYDGFLPPEGTAYPFVYKRFKPSLGVEEE